MRIIKTAIIVDPGGSMCGTDEDEVKEIKKEWKQQLKPHKVNFYRAHSAYPGDIKLGTNLILFDYGGMGYGNDLGERNSQHLTQYCIDNPSTLALVISSYTWNRMVKTIIKDFGYNDLPNLKVVDWLSDEIIPKWFMYDLDAPEPTKGYFCQLCHTDLESTSRKDKSLTHCVKCNKLYCEYCRWENGVKGVNLLCVDCGEEYDDA